MRLLIINLSDICREQLDEAVSQLTAHVPEWKMVDATQLRIAPCTGCCKCMLITPGECCIRDDAAQLIKECISADNIVLIVDTALNFVDHKGKSAVERLFPLASMTLHYKDGEIFHTSRYEGSPGTAILYTSKADQEMLEMWLTRFTKNMNSRFLGVAPLSNASEVGKWIP